MDDVALDRIAYMTVACDMKAFLIVIAAPRLASAFGVAQAETASAIQVQTILSAEIDVNGQLAIVTSNGQAIVVRKEGEQTSFSMPIMSYERTAVAAQAMFPSCCASYDIPLQLVVFARGKVHRFKGKGLPIFRGFCGRRRMHRLWPGDSAFRVRDPL